MATIEEMRKAVSAEYESLEWEKQVRNMPDKQVMAIFFKLQGKSQKKKKNSKVFSIPIYSVPKQYEGYRWE